MLERILVDGYPSAAAAEIAIAASSTSSPRGSRSHVMRSSARWSICSARAATPMLLISLEELWNSLAPSRSFSLLCGYRLHVFDREAQARPCPRSAARTLTLCRRPTRPGIAWRSTRRSSVSSASSAPGRSRLRRRADPPRNGCRRRARALMWVSANIPAIRRSRAGAVRCCCVAVGAKVRTRHPLLQSRRSSRAPRLRRPRARPPQLR